MARAVFAGSFDPPTYGHRNLIERASRLFDEVVVVVAVNYRKAGLFSPEERLAFLRNLSSPFKNVSVRLCDGLLIDFVRAIGATVMVRGLRNGADFSAELELALWNKELAPEVETVFLPTEAPYLLLSSSAVRELATFGRDISAFVPGEVATALASRLEALASHDRIEP
jgi:pantetheine-phosphate adenylyltransferase